MSVEKSLRYQYLQMYCIFRANIKIVAAAFIALTVCVEMQTSRLTNLGGGTATLRLLSATSRPFWAQATNRNAMKNCWGEQRCRKLSDDIELNRCIEIYNNSVWCDSTRHFYLFVESPLPFRVCQIPDLWRHTQLACSSSSTLHAQQRGVASALLWLFAYLPQDQVGQGWPFQEQSCICCCHPPTACGINLHTNRYKHNLHKLAHILIRAYIIWETTVTDLYC